MQAQFLQLHSENKLEVLTVVNTHNASGTVSAFILRWNMEM